MKHVLLFILFILSTASAKCQLTVTEAIVCPGDTVGLIAHSDSADIYEWYRDGQYLTTTSNNVVRVADLGAYSVIAYNLYGCKSDPSNAFILAHDTIFAESDTASMHYTTRTVIPIMKNDRSGCYGLNPSSIQILSGPWHGKAFIKGDGTVEYVPTERVSNIDQFYYTVTDMRYNLSNPALVTIWVGSECGVVYPNPTPDKAVIRTRNEEVRNLRVCDISGRILFTQPMVAGEKEISVGGFPDAVYIIQLMNEAGKAICTFKLDKRQLY